MPNCPDCGLAAPDGARFCSGCASPLRDDEAATATSLPSRTAALPSSPSSSGPSEEARFLPGSTVADRYRVLGLLGVGGMGEVYRADDLKLGQPVALKFLPRQVESDEGRLERFLNEVRLALRITHPNVCRVYDIGEVDGQHFISMEYVDGEDLASLLRRIGRMPQERAVEIARQLCSGLAAAHEQGILHRDLKPANVMIDGRGRAKITDFGLADRAGSVEGAEVRAGTPAYMAPEQLSGSGVSERSDIYALGLVLYELFTGKPAFRAETAAERARLQKTPPTSPTSHVRDLDPAVEAVLLRTLEPDPARRPASAMAVAAALPGGDPLAAAVAAGETPSPEMVAEAGEAGALRPGWILLCTATIIACLVGLALARPRADALGWIETPHSTTALQERARLMIERLGLEPRKWTAGGLATRWDYVRWLREEHPAEMRQRVAAGRPAVYVAWHRQSPDRMVPEQVEDRVTQTDPPMDRPGMVRVQLDPQGRLVDLVAVPPDRDLLADGDLEKGAEPPWPALFREAGLEPARFTPVEPERTPPVFADHRAAWEGTLEEAPETTLRIEAAAYRGRPVSFRILGPWSQDRGSPSERGTLQLVLAGIAVAVMLSVLAGLALLARRNIRAGRSDLQGAIRIAGFILAIELFARIVAGGYLFGGQALLWRTIRRLMEVGFLMILVFLAYMALEPYLRRLWPRTMISWSRLLKGRLRDPRVGRDLLLGITFGMLVQLAWAVHIFLPGLLGLAQEPLLTTAAGRGGDPAAILSLLLKRTGGAVGMTLMVMLTLVLLRLALRSPRAAIGVVFVFSTLFPNLASSHPALDIPIEALTYGLFLFVLLRIGLLAAMAMRLVGHLTGTFMTLDPSSWLGTTSLMSLAPLLAIAAFGALTALGARGLLRDEL